MHEIIEQMLARYRPKTSAESIRALREIIQEIALVGLWRAKFFEKAAFYGGTALRILYGLDRFSEDLDFSLLKPTDDFTLASYNKAIEAELNALGFEVSVSTREKSLKNQIESAFIKTNTKKELINIGLENFALSGIAREATIKIKLEVDVNPPGFFNTETKTLKEPIPVSIVAYAPADLYAGKMHALLCRMWKERIKGRDWYDFVWFVRKKIPLNLNHLEKRMWQSGHLPEGYILTEAHFHNLLHNKIEALDITNAIKDIQPFIADVSLLSNWSKDYFKEHASQIIFEKNA